MNVAKFADQAAARAWVEAQAPRLVRPAVVLLSGPLGAGKTQFVRWFLAALGTADVSSPTFAIHQEYRTPAGTVDHVDLYRVLSDADLEASGFWDLFLNDNGLVFVEWADRLPHEIWPAGWQRWFLELHAGVGEERSLSWVIEGPG